MSSIEAARDDPRSLEELYRSAVTSGDELLFVDAIAALLVRYPDSLLLQAWSHRLDIAREPGPRTGTAEIAQYATRRHWLAAILTSVALGLVFVLLTWEMAGRLADPASPRFLLGWAPATAAAVLVFSYATGPDRRRLQLYVGALLLLALLFGLAAWKGWIPLAAMRDADREPAGLAQAWLIALHLPFVCWGVLAGAMCAALGDVWRQVFAFVAKSAETIVTAGLYVIAGGVFTGLTVGIFRALGVTLSEQLVVRFVCWGAGAVPVLAVATVYDPTGVPADQEWHTGLARVIRILVRLLLPLTIGVLLVYDAYFIPTQFMKAFTQRETLIIYNITIIAIIAVLAVAAPGLDERLAGRGAQILRLAIMTAAILTLLLNAYALAAIVSRTISGGYTPNRHAVIGWNVVTLAILGSVLLRQALARGRPWADVWRHSMAQALVLAVAWSAWVVVGLPHF